MSGLRRVKVVVRGFVQGVGFRYFALVRAREYGITGWVRNREDGSVEVEAQGGDSILKAFVKDLGIGPRSAEVSGVEVEELPPGESGKGFTVR